MPSIKEFVEAMTASWHAAAAAFLGSVFVIIADIFDFRYLKNLPEWVLAATFIVLVFSTAIILVSLLKHGFHLLRKSQLYKRDALKKSGRVQRLRELPDSEWNFLVARVVQSEQVFLARIDDPIVNALKVRGYVHMVGGTHSILQWPYQIPDYVWDAVKNELVDQKW